MLFATKGYLKDFLQTIPRKNTWKSQTRFFWEGIHLVKYYIVSFYLPFLHQGSAWCANDEIKAVVSSAGWRTKRVITVILVDFLHAGSAYWAGTTCFISGLLIWGDDYSCRGGSLHRVHLQTARKQRTGIPSALCRAAVTTQHIYKITVSITKAIQRPVASQI